MKNAVILSRNLRGNVQMNSGAAATQLREVQVYTPDLHVSIEPNGPEPQGTLLDSHGDAMPPVKKGLMVRIDAKAKEEVTLSKGTVWMIGAVPVILAVALNYGAAAFGWVREDQSKTLQIQQLQNDVNTIKDDVRAMKDIQQQQAIKDAEKRGYQLGAVDGTTGHANVKK